MHNDILRQDDNQPTPQVNIHYHPVLNIPLKTDKKKQDNHQGNPYEDTMGLHQDYFGVIGTSMWIFDYLEFIENYDFGDDPDITEAAYFWDFDNHGNKLIKVRFYPI